MKQKPLLVLICFFFLLSQGVYMTSFGQEGLAINDQGYFEMTGLDVIVFDDYYPIGRQGGVTIIQNGERVAANGGITLGEPLLKEQTKKLTGHLEQSRRMSIYPISRSVTM